MAMLRGMTGRDYSSIFSMDTGTYCTWLLGSSSERKSNTRAKHARAGLMALDSVAVACVDISCVAWIRTQHAFWEPATVLD